MKLTHVLAATGLVAGVPAVPTSAAYIAQFLEDGSDVTFFGSGSIDTTALTLAGKSLGTDTRLWSDREFYLFSNGYDYYDGIIGPGNFGSGPEVNPTEWAGPSHGIYNRNERIYLPLGYISGSLLAPTTSTFAGQSFDSLGLTPGTYVWTWGSGANADSYTLNIGLAPPVPEADVPAPGALGLVGLGLFGAGVMRRKPA